MTVVEQRAEVDVPGRRRPRWWLEIPFAVGFYAIYAQVRDLHGSATEHSRGIARSHGYAVLHLERWLHLDVERGLQSVVLHARPLVVAMDVFYGSAHFVVTCGVFLWLLFRQPAERFRHGRNVLATGTAIGLVVFALYPTMPPRLMPPGVKTIDTLSAVGGLWSYNHGVLEHITDPYAAMPSLHIVWSGWVAYVLWQATRERRAAWLCWAYPVLTGVTILATGVHWTLDLAGGAAVLAASLVVTRRAEAFRRDRRAARGQGRAVNESTDSDSGLLASRSTQR